MTATPDPAANEQTPRAPGPLFTVLTTAGLLAFAAFFVGVQMGGTRAGVAEVLAVLLATTVFARSAFNGTLPRPFNASLGVLLMALFVGITALSVGWSLLPNASMLDAIRLISYTSVLALAALVAQLHQDRARELLLGVGLAALLIAAYALFSHCFPGLFGEGDNFARLRLPFGYWNAVGTVAGIGIVVALWAGTRRNDARWLEVASYPAGGAFAVAMMLSQSRGALLALAIVIGVWLLIVPQRLRTAGWLAAVGALSLVVVFWAYNNDALSTDAWPMDKRETAGLELFAALLVLSGLLGGVGFWVRSRRFARPLRSEQRYTIGRVLLVLLALSPFVLAIGVTVGTDKGFSTITDGVGSLFSTNGTAPSNSPGRLTQTTSLRGRYWSDSFKVFKAHKLHGTGGDTFLVARLPYRKDQLTASHSHGMVPQVAADLGIYGLLVLFGLTAVWLVAAFKLAGASARAPIRWLDEADETRLASVTIMLVALMFGLHSAIDWIWFVPAVAYFGLLTGGWVLGSPAAHSLPDAAPEAAAARGRIQTVRAIAIAIVGIAIAYAVYQPVRAERKISAGLDQAQSNPVKALKLGEDALKLDPTSANAQILIALAQSNGGREQEAEETLVELTSEQPGNPAAWLRLASFRLNQLHHPDGAIEALRPLLYQSPNNVQGLALYDAAQQAKVDQLVQKAADKRRKQLEKMLEQAARLKRQAAQAQAGAPTP